MSFIGSSSLPGTRANLNSINEFSKLIKSMEHSNKVFSILFDFCKIESNENDPETEVCLADLLGLSHYYFNQEYTLKVKIFIY